MLLFYTFFASDLIGKLIILSLLITSFYSIAIIFKYGYFFYINDQLGDNLKIYIPKTRQIARINAEPSMYLELYDKMLDFHINKMFDLNVHAKLDSNLDQLDKEIQSIYLRWECKIASDIDSISILGSIAPFVGLLGTVLGIMNSFQAIAKANSNSITVVAPALSEALCVTALGIFVAIPANIAANYFYSKLEYCKKDLYIFKDFILDEFKRKMDR